MRIARATLATGLVLLGAAVSGCGQNKLDTGRAETAIRAGITRQTGVKIESVSCPSDVDARKGETFRCAARAKNGQRARVEVTQRDDQGAVSWRLLGRR